MDYIKNQSSIWSKVADIKDEKVEQLREAIKNARVDTMVNVLNDINEILMLRIYDEEVDDSFKLRVIDSIRKNYEFMVKVTDVSNSMVMDEISNVGKPGSVMIEVSGAVEPLKLIENQSDE